MYSPSLKFISEIRLCLEFQPPARKKKSIKIEATMLFCPLQHGLFFFTPFFSFIFIAHSIYEENFIQIILIWNVLIWNTHETYHFSSILPKIHFELEKNILKNFLKYLRWTWCVLWWTKIRYRSGRMVHLWSFETASYDVSFVVYLIPYHLSNFPKGTRIQIYTSLWECSLPLVLFIRCYIIVSSFFPWLVSSATEVLDTC